MHSAFQSQPQQPEPTCHITLSFDRDAYDGKVGSRFLVSIVDLSTNEAIKFRRNGKTKIDFQPKISLRRILSGMIINSVFEHDMKALFSLRVEHRSDVFQAANAKVSFTISELMDTAEVVSSETAPQFVLSPIRSSTGKMCSPSTYSPTCVQQMTHCPPPLSLMSREQQKQVWQEHNSAVWQQQHYGNTTSWSAVDPSVMSVPPRHRHLSHDDQYYGPMTPPQNVRRSYSYSS